MPACLLNARALSGIAIGSRAITTMDCHPAKTHAYKKIQKAG
jgi:hypothetical protein